MNPEILKNYFNNRDNKEINPLTKLIEKYNYLKENKNDSTEREFLDVKKAMVNSLKDILKCQKQLKLPLQNTIRSCLEINRNKS